MLMNLRRSLLISAAARDLAIGLVRDHGAVALDIIDRSFSGAGRGGPGDGAASETERLLVASRSHVLSLIGVRPDGDGYRPGDAESADPARRRSKRSR